MPRMLARLLPSNAALGVLLPALVALASLTGSACRGARASCLEGASSRSAERTVAVCSAEYQRTGDPRVAVAAVQAHVALKDDAAVLRWAERVGEAPGAALIWRRAMQAHQRRGEHDQMLVAGRRSMALWKKQGAPGDGAYDGHVLKESLWERSELLTALEIARKARALALASTDQEMRHVTLFDLFGILGEVGDYAGAAAILREAQGQLAEMPDEARRELWVAEGLMHFRRGNLELARQAYRKAAAGPPVANQRAAFYNLSEIAVMQGEPEVAARELASAVALLPEDPPPALLAARAYFTALVAIAQGEPPRAVAEARGALARQPSLDWQWQLEIALGKALEAQGQTDDAVAAYRRAIAAVERMRKEVALDPLQVALRDRKRAPYEAVFELEARRGQVAAAMEISRLMWQRGFVEAFVEEPAPEGPEGPAGSEGPAGRQEPAGEGGAARDPAAERIRGLTQLVPQLAARSGEGASPAGTAGSAGEAAVVAAGGVEALAFIEARGGLWRYHRGEHAERLERLPLSAERARQLVAELRAHPEEEAAARSLAEVLLPPRIAAAGARDRPLAIIADGALAGLPFAALRVGPRWLVQERVLVYWPALSRLAPGVRGADTAAVVLAATASRGDGPQLGAARREAEGVAQLVGVAPQLGEAATIAALRKSASASLLHLAAHGGLSPGGAFVRLADGEVTVADVVTWRLAPRVVVLASCASGARPSGSMWGALGGAFLAAGSQAVMATLWSVEDEATASLVRAFYAAGGATDPARALSQAQRAAIAAGVSPRHWAAFVALAES
jgi:CHAT domain-containing protein/tetratricopeptide (TPR) repeat protein